MATAQRTDFYTFSEDGSYFKIKSVTLGYIPSGDLYGKLSIDNQREHITVDNLLCVLTNKYSGYDPELSYTADPSSTGYGQNFGLAADYAHITDLGA